MEHREPAGDSDASDGMMVRQAPLNLKLPKGVAVVGCGGVGSWVAYFLALSGVKEIWLFDHDELSEHNLNRVLAQKEDIGTLKSQAVAKYIKQFRPDCNVLPMSRFSKLVVDSSEMFNYVDWIVAATDTKASRDLVYDWADKNAIAYIEAAAEGEYGSATAIPGEWQTELENDPGYASVPVWVGPCVLAATIAVSHIVHGGYMGDRTIRIGWDADNNSFDIFDSQPKEKEVNYELEEENAEIERVQPEPVVDPELESTDVTRTEDTAADQVRERAVQTTRSADIPATDGDNAG